MINKTLLISPEFVKKLTGINDAITEEIILPHILTAQELALEPLVGSELYAALLAGSHTEFKESYVYPYLAWSTVESSLPLIYQRVGNGGVFVNNPENSQSASGNQYSAISSWAGGKVASYGKRLFDEVIRTFSSIPLNEPKKQKVIRGISL